VSDDDVRNDAGDAGGDASGVDSKRRRTAPIIVLVVAIVVGGLFWILGSAKSGESADTADSPLLGRPAPAVKATTLDGKPFDLQRRKGSWVVLNFFNSTCVPCVKEHPELVKFADEQSELADGAELYTVINYDDEGAVRDFFAENGGSWPVLSDPNADISVAFGISKVPETWIVDPDGFVVQRAIVGLTDDQLTRLLEQAKAAES
jgi:cytochrome c biogenesis protein CcmG/thiol:disulfide interchange protein DsbE